MVVRTRSTPDGGRRLHGTQHGSRELRMAHGEGAGHRDGDGVDTTSSPIHCGETSCIHGPPGQWARANSFVISSWILLR